MSERRFVRRWNVLGTHYNVVRTKIEGGDEGEFDAWAGEVRISEEVPPNREWEVESHELVGHVVCHATGFGRTLRDTFGVSESVAEKIEEEVIARLLPIQLDTLERNGLLTRPAPSAPPNDKASK